MISLRINWTNFMQIKANWQQIVLCKANFKAPPPGSCKIITTLRKFCRMYRILSLPIFSLFLAKTENIVVCPSLVFLSLVLVKPVDCQWWFWRYYRWYCVYETCNQIYRSLLFSITLRKSKWKPVRKISCLYVSSLVLSVPVQQGRGTGVRDGWCYDTDSEPYVK